MLIVERVGPMVTVQDRGRRGHARSGVPRSGPLDEECFLVALAAVGGLDGQAAVEIPLSSARFAVEGSVVCSIDGEAPRTFRDEVIDVPASQRAVRYLAVRGGVAIPPVLGSRATLAFAGLGHVLARGDRLPVGSEAGAPRLAPPIALDDEPLEVMPVADAVALHALLEGVFAVDARSDRVGVRLRGDPLAAPTRDRLSRPLVPGAIQLPPDGLPIVIGPDGPTTGGYPLCGVLTSQSRARLARRRPGAAVRFAIAGNSR